MSARPDFPPVADLEACDQYVVSHGKSGVIGVFTVADATPLRRGQAVIVQSSRGLEVGTVLRAATLRQARLLGAASSGELLRRVTRDDQGRRREQTTLEHEIFETSRAWAQRDELALDILDVDLLFDGQQAIVQFVGAEADTDAFAQALEEHFNLAIRLENLAAPIPHDEQEHGCDKPDCGRTAGGGACTTCSTGGGCSSCGSSKVDLREYFGHLRTQMEAKQRTPLA